MDAGVISGCTTELIVIKINAHSIEFSANYATNANTRGQSDLI